MRTALIELPCIAAIMKTISESDRRSAALLWRHISPTMRVCADDFRAVVGAPD
jgi:hypothetical protein